MRLTTDVLWRNMEKNILNLFPFVPFLSGALVLAIMCIITFLMMNYLYMIYVYFDERKVGRIIPFLIFDRFHAGDAVKE